MVPPLTTAPPPILPPVEPALFFQPSSATISLCSESANPPDVNHCLWCCCQRSCRLVQASMLADEDSGSGFWVGCLDARSERFSLLRTWISMVMLLCSSSMVSYSRPSSRHISSLSLASFLDMLRTSLEREINISDLYVCLRMIV